MQPNGIDQVPFWTNLNLYDYEAEFVSNLTKTDKFTAIKFKNASRCIDDECKLE